MFDLKVINSVLSQLEEERGIPREKIIEAIEMALATAYKKDYGKKGQIVNAKFDINSGTSQFFQVKNVVDDSVVMSPDEMEDMSEVDVEIMKEEAKLAQEDAEAAQAALEAGEEIEEGADKVTIRKPFNEEHDIMIKDAQKIKKDVVLGEELTFPLEVKDDYGRIASQTAKQVIIQKIREAEKTSVFKEYGEKEGEIVNGTVQRIERGNIFVDMGRAPGFLPYEEQIPGERYRQGERIRAYLYNVEESPKGVFLKLSRSHPKFLEKLFEVEAPEIAAGTVEIKAIAREAGSRTKLAVVSYDDHIDPVGSLVGQRGVRVTTVMSELGGEKIDIIEWSEDPKEFIEDAISPAKALSVTTDEEAQAAVIEVTDDQQSLAIGKGGQNVRLAAKLTGWKIDIKSAEGEGIAETDKNGEVEIKEEVTPKPEEEAVETKEKLEDNKAMPTGRQEK